ncbi:MAG: galactosyltransferase-related protein [Thermosynechococcaceae cyanobacterium]
MRLTLITPYRNRPNHLSNQLAWWSQYAFKQEIEWILVEVTPEPSGALQQTLQDYQVGYLHLPCAGPFHKTKALNLGLAQARGDLIAAFDVDLIPIGQTLEQHCRLAEQSPHFLVTGYRLMAQTETVALSTLDASLLQATLGPEDQPTALHKQLLKGERFGVMPLFEHQTILDLGGWDETFMGWGAEDQDLIERYLALGKTFCRCPQLRYLHLKHGGTADWNSPRLTQQNRQHYYDKRQRNIL